MLGVAAMAAVGAARTMVESDNQAGDAPLPSPATSGADDQVALNIDLGLDGEPKGITRIFFKPQLARSELSVVECRVPLGLLIEQRNNTIVVTGALPGYSAIHQAFPGDILRAVTAYAEVVSGAPMWQQVASGTPMGTRQRKRLLFRADGASYSDVRNAIASHREAEGGNGVVTLVIERQSNSSVRPSPREAAQLQSLTEVLMQDLQMPTQRGMTDELDSLSAAQRARRLLGLDEEADD